jgi:hypothetical protein
MHELHSPTETQITYVDILDFGPSAYSGYTGAFLELIFSGNVSKIPRLFS